LPAEKRSLGMGIASAAGSFGQFAMLPGTLGLDRLARLVDGASGAGRAGRAMIVPLVEHAQGSARCQTLGGEQTLKEALREACSATPGFWLCWRSAFFVCGFQVVFIGIHLPAYLVDQHLPATVGTTVLALIGLFNIFRHLHGGLAGRADVQAAPADRRCTWRGLW
jgi:hypothetical protein